MLLPVSREVAHSLLQGCIKSKDVSAGRHLHSLLILSGIHGVGILGDLLIRLFASSHAPFDASLVFCSMTKPSVHTWQAIISAHTSSGRHHMALQLFSYMQTFIISPNKFLFTSVLNACSHTLSIPYGKQLHADIAYFGLEQDTVVGTALLDMYAKCGCLRDAYHVFDNLPHKNLVTWTAIIAAYVNGGNGLAALKLIQRMLESSFELDGFILSCALKACGSLGCLLQGMHIHNEAIQGGFISDPVIGNTLVDMYAKCGSLQEAQKTLSRLSTCSVASWSALISGYAHNGNCKVAWHCLEEMRRRGLQPDAGVYISILSACSHAGEVEMGLQYFKAMVCEHGVNQSMDQVNCIIDLLGRAGHLKEATNIFKGILSSADGCGWRSLLNACSRYGTNDVPALV